jgi:hypothetical protein
VGRQSWGMRSPRSKRRCFSAGRQLSGILNRGFCRQSEIAVKTKLIEVLLEKAFGALL